jgi:hypothetical protein
MSYSVCCWLTYRSGVELRMKTFPIAVIIERQQLDNRWVSEKWEVVGIVPAFDSPSDDSTPRRIFADAKCEQFLVGGFALELFRDEVDNYHLNITSPIPKVFVMWRMDEEAGVESKFARPIIVTVSYGEAARFLDSGEQVDGVAMPQEIADWVGDFVNTHYKPAGRKKVKRNDPLVQAREKIRNTS